MKLQKVVFACGALLAAACGGGGADSITRPLTPAAVATVSVSLSSASVNVGATPTATATLLSASGATLSGRAIAWVSSNPGVASVNASGSIATLSPGTTVITATSEGQSGGASLSVTAASVATVTVSLATSTIVVNGTTQATAVVKDAGGVTLSDRHVTWQSSAPSIAAVTSTGAITALAPGSTVITASIEGRSGTAALAVTSASVATVQVSPGVLSIPTTQSVTLQATLRDNLQNVLTNRTISWTTSNQSIATVATATGTVTAVAPGTAMITATSEGKSGTATITVTSVGVATVSLSTGPFSILAGDFKTLIATARDASGNVLTGRNVLWYSSNLNVVDGYVFGDTAVVTGLAPGSSTITAEIDGRQASVTVTVLTPTANVCTLIAGATIVGGDGQYLGRFTNQYDSESVFNAYGIYGSPYQSKSTNNSYGTYGSPYSNLSARNPYATNPPVIVKNGTSIAYYTVNPAKSPSVAPAYALTCNFP